MKPPLSREELLRVSSAQKLLLWTILLSILISLSSVFLSPVIAQMAIRGEISVAMFDVYRFGIMGLAVAILVLQIVSVIRLCLALKEGWATVIYAIFQFVPCLSLILLLFLNGRATSRLKEAGIRVGLMGAKASDLSNYEPPQTGKTCQNCGEVIDVAETRCPVCGAVAAVPGQSGVS